MDSHPKKKILIIEDDEHIARVYSMKFAKEGYDTILATNGEEGMEKIITEKPDLVVLDMMLPKKDGFFVLEEIKKNPDLANIRILIISNLGQKTDQDRALALGANEYLVKVESSMQEVVDKVKSYLQ
ncbi:MAG: response regulator [Patescibacteria group bacterium]